MLGSIATASIITLEIGLITYQMHKQGVFKDLYSKYAKQVRDTVQQPNLKELSWKIKSV